MEIEVLYRRGRGRALGTDSALRRETPKRVKLDQIRLKLHQDVARFPVYTSIFLDLLYTQGVSISVKAASTFEGTAEEVGCTQQPCSAPLRR